jgi:hypothetical protein
VVGLPFAPAGRPGSELAWGGPGGLPVFAALPGGGCEGRVLVVVVVVVLEWLAVLPVPLLAIATPTPPASVTAATAVAIVLR